MTASSLLPPRTTTNRVSFRLNRKTRTRKGKNENEKNLRGNTSSQSHLRRLETVFRDTYRLYPKRSKNNFPSSESNQFLTCLDQRIEFLNKGRSMTIAFIMLISVMGKSRYIVIGDGRGESSIYFFPQPITSGFFFCAKALLLSVFYRSGKMHAFLCGLHGEYDI